jgi:hypothetical protein
MIGRIPTTFEPVGDYRPSDTWQAGAAEVRTVVAIEFPAK